MSKQKKVFDVAADEQAFEAAKAAQAQEAAEAPVQGEVVEEAEAADAPEAEAAAEGEATEEASAPVEPASAKETEIFKTKLAAADQAAAAAKEQLLRTAAEYENFRKRSAREADMKFNDGVSYAINQIIPILDTLEMAEKAPCADESYKKGVTMTLDKAAKALENLRITEIEAEGKAFDPNTMNAVSQVPAPEGMASGDVVTVYQKGYMVGDKIIRHATVVVAE